MTRITRESLLTLEAYSKARAQFRARVISHKKSRTVHLGEHVTLLFEDELTIRYQIQEMLRAERIFEEDGIAAELDIYNPLVPDGSNWKATMLLEYPDPAERRTMLAQLVGIEDDVWIEIEGCARVYAIANEGLSRKGQEKTAAVHFLRFDATPHIAGALKHGALLSVGVDHPRYSASAVLDRAVSASLLDDLAA